MFEIIKVYDPFEPELVEWPVKILKACHQGKGGGSPPAPPPAPTPPDPYATAQAQGAQNRAAAISQAEIAMVNQQTPYGGLEWSPRGLSDIKYVGGIGPGDEGYDAEKNIEYGGTPQYTAVQTLSPEQQQILDLSNQAQVGYGQTAIEQLEGVKDRLSSPIDFANVAAAPTINLEDFVGTAPTASFAGIPQPGQLDYSGLGAAPQFDQAYQDQISQAIRDRADIWQIRDLDRLENRLTNQGINIGTEAWNQEMARRQAGINDFNLAADLQGLQQASQKFGVEQAARQLATGELGNIYSAGVSDRDRAIAEASQLFGLEANARDRAVQEASQLFSLQAGARDRAINELMIQRNQPLNELAAMLSGQQVVQPNFLTPPQPGISAGDLQGATYANYQGALGQQQMANQNNLIGYQAQQQANNAMTGGLFGLGSAAIMKYSDRRLKKNATIIGKLKNGLNIYSFNYIWENGAKQFGVMADEVRKVLPHAVHRRDGFDMVDYSEVI